MTLSEFLSAGGWGIFALIAAVFTAGFYLTSQYMRQSGDIVMFWMRLVVIVVLLPFMQSMPMPDNIWFYVTVVATAVFGIAADVRVFNVGATYGAGVVSRLMPVVVWGSFFVWFLFEPSLIGRYLAEPLRAAGITLALFSCVYFAMRLNRSTVSRAALREMLPAILAYVMTTVLNKLAMTQGFVAGGYAGAVYGYMLLQSAAGVLILGGYLLLKKRGQPRQPAGWAGTMGMMTALISGFIWVTHMTYKNYAVAFAPHPSYQAAVNLTAPVFVLLFYKLAGYREAESPKAGIGVVISAAVLLILTAGV